MIPNLAVSESLECDHTASSGHLGAALLACVAELLRCFAAWQHNAKFVETVRSAELPSIFNNLWPNEATPGRHVWSSRHFSCWVFVAH